MGQFKVIKCPSCGSSVIESEGESIAKCSHCGTSLVLEGQNMPKLLELGKQIRSLLLVTVIVVIALFIFNQFGKSDQLEIPEDPTNKQPTGSTAPTIEIPKLNINIPVIDASKLQPSKEEVVKSKQKNRESQVAVIHQIQGKTIIGGLFWIFQIRNEGKTEVSRPGLLMSLFNEKGKRIDELRVWSKLEHLKPGQETEVLLLLQNPPKNIAKIETVGMGKPPSKYEIYQEFVKIKEFIVKANEKNPKRVEIIGDVYNPHAFQVNYVEVIAVARNKQGLPVGIANSYASYTNLPAKQSSGFKIKAGTFIAEEPEKWTLWAVGRRDRSNP